MSLSAQQRTSLFQVLEMPMFGTVNKLIDPDNLTVEPRIAADSTRNAIIQLDNHLQDLSDNYPDLEIELKIHLDSWSSLGTQSWTLDGGTAGIQGVAMGPESQRLEIRRHILPIVPFYRHHEEMSHIDELQVGFNVCRN